jgi:DNA-binding response OmpR family regulator
MPAKKTTILIADDDVQILRLLTRSLQLADYAVAQATDGEQALAYFDTETPDLLMLDVMMPVMDGFTVCERVREFSSVPIIILTARGQDQDKVRGLDLGADDYLTKPFNLDEMQARVRGALRRSQMPAHEALQGKQSIIQIGDLTIDLAQHRVLNGTRELVLTPVEFRIVAYLAQHAGRVVTQDTLIEHVWGHGYAGESHLLHVGVNRLRRKLERDPATPDYILTRVGVGYIMLAQPGMTYERKSA